MKELMDLCISMQKNKPGPYDQCHDGIGQFKHSSFSINGEVLESSRPWFHIFLVML